MTILDGITTVIFDLDGTLLDTMGLWNQVDRELTRRLGKPEIATENIHQLREKILTVAKNDPDPYLSYCTTLGKLCQSNLSPEDIHAMRYSISRELMKNSAKPRDGVIDILRTLTEKGLTLAIATTTKKRNITVYAEQNPHTRIIDFYSTFKAILTVEDTPNAKPAPDIFLKTATTLSVDPQNCLVIEDSLQGVQAGRAAGMRVVCVREKHAEAYRETLQKLAHYYFNDFYELKSALN